MWSSWMSSKRTPAPTGPSSAPSAARPELFPFSSTIDEGKKQVERVGTRATDLLNNASATTRAAAGSSIELYSREYYAACTLGGILACGPTHTAITPLDFVKTRRQVDPKLYKSNIQGWRVIYRGEGVRCIMTGWSPTLVGYSLQGAFKYGWYEYFKHTYSVAAGPEAAVRYKTGLFLAAAASAEFLADMALCPLEAIKVRMQGEVKNPYRGTVDGITSVIRKEGVAGLYKGLYPLWARQIPYTMMKFASFETAVEMIYAHLPGTKDDYSKTGQTAVSFVGGYIAGILCAIISHPSDVMVSQLNAHRAPGEGIGSAVGRVYRQIGFGGLWNGLPIRIVMVGTLTGLQWMIYDYFKIVMGLPTTGGH